MTVSQWKNAVWSAWIRNDQQELANLRSLIVSDGTGRFLHEEAKHLTNDAHPGYQHAYKNGHCIYNGCTAGRSEQDAEWIEAKKQQDAGRLKHFYVA